MPRTNPKRSNDDPLENLRRVCLAFPETTEKEAWETPTFRVREKMFAMYVDNHHDDGRVAVWCKALPGVQEIVVGAAPHKFFRPPYVGHKGWIGICLDVDVDWKEIAGFIDDSYRMTAPKRLLAAVGTNAAATAAERPTRKASPKKAARQRPA